MPFGVSSAAHRCSEAIRQCIVDGKAGLWVAVRLSDGGWDRYAYESRAEAIKWQPFETLCAYVKVPEDDMSPAAAERFMQLMREAYDRGYRPSGATADHQIILPATVEDLARHLPQQRTR